MKIRFTQKARTNIDSLYVYSQEHFPESAQMVLDTIERMIDNLVLFPDLGKSGRVEGTKELVMPHFPFFVSYEISGNFINILAILHQRQCWGD